MAVVVQRMVDSRSSGVMFTRSPLTGDRSVIAIDASWGLGSAVVSGDVTPDSFVVSKVTGEITRRTVATKTRWHQPDTGRPGRGRDRRCPAELQDVPSLSDDEIAELVAVARTGRGALRLARRTSSGRCRGRPPPARTCFLLQSRPETVWAEKDRAKVAAPAARAFDHVLQPAGRQAPVGGMTWN